MAGPWNMEYGEQEMETDTSKVLYENTTEEEAAASAVDADKLATRVGNYGRGAINRGHGMADYYGYYVQMTDATYYSYMAKISNLDKFGITKEIANLEDEEQQKKVWEGLTNEDKERQMHEQNIFDEQVVRNTEKAAKEGKEGEMAVKNYNTEQQDEVDQMKEKEWLKEEDENGNEVWWQNDGVKNGKQTFKRMHEGETIMKEIDEFVQDNNGKGQPQSGGMAGGEAPGIAESNNGVEAGGMAGGEGSGVAGDDGKSTQPPVGDESTQPLATTGKFAEDFHEEGHYYY